MASAALQASMAPEPPLWVSSAARRGGLKAGERRIGWLFSSRRWRPSRSSSPSRSFGRWAYAFTRYDLQTPSPVYVGLDNFRAILSSPDVLGAFATTAVYVGLATVLHVLIGLGWAILLNQTFRGRTALRALSLLPWVLPSTVCAFVWGWIFNSRYGVLNAVLLEAGLIPFPTAWLSTSTGAMVAIVVTKVWLSIPPYMMFFLAGLQGMDREQIDAARVDGAGNWPILRDHILPHLKPVLLVVVVLGIIGNLQQFDTIYALTGGGPVRATTVLSIEVYRRAFDQWDIGMASAIGLLWVATILPAAYVYLRHLLKGV
jgi:multiple sugar transport system permease protein